MKNARLTKALVLVFSLVLLIGSAIGIATSAADSEATKPVIVSKNIEYKGDFGIMYAVDASTVNGEGTVTLYLYDQLPAEGVEPIRTYTDSSAEDITVGDATVSAYVFYTQGVASKDMADYYYAVAEDATGAQSAVYRYSVAQYMYERLYRMADELTAEQKELYESTLVFGANAQKVLAKGETLVTDCKYIYLDSAVATLADGFMSGVYASGTTLTLTAIEGCETNESGEPLVRFNLIDPTSGETVASVAPGEEFTITENLKAVPYYGWRGTGAYVDKAISFDNISDLTASDDFVLRESSADAVSTSSVVSTELIGGDTAYKTIGQNNASSGTVFKSQDTLDVGSGIVFETDIMFESVVTTRSDGGIMAFGGTNNTGSVYTLYGFTLNFNYVDGQITLTPQLASDYSHSSVIELGEWTNIRYELDNLSTPSTCRLYVNGELVITAKTATAVYSGDQVYISGIDMYTMGWNTTGTTYYVDNVYVGAIADQTYRGTGKYAQNENTFTMDDISGETKGSATTTNENITFTNKGGLSSATVGDDKVLMTQGSTGYQTNTVFTTDTTITKSFAYEFDIMFSGAASTRSGGEVLQVIPTNNPAATGVLNNGKLSFTMVDGKLTLSPHSRYNLSIEFETMKWYNIRYEVDNALGASEHRLYINGECVLASEGGGVYSGDFVVATGIDFYGLWNTANTVFFTDNVYVGEIIE